MAKKTKEDELEETGELENTTTQTDESEFETAGEEQQVETLVDLSTPIRMSREYMEVPLILEDKKGQERHYCIRELGGEDRDHYMNTMGTKAQFNEAGNPAGLKDYAGIHLALICKCVRGAELSKDKLTVLEAGPLVKREVLAALPARVQSAIFDRVKKISGMDEDAEDRAKKA